MQVKSDGEIQKTSRTNPVCHCHCHEDEVDDILAENLVKIAE